MGLNKEVRDFFTERIGKVLDKKLAQISKAIDEQKVKEEVISRFCARWGAGNLPTRWQKAKQQLASAEKDIKGLQTEVEKALALSGENIHNWTTYGFESLESRAQELYKEEVLAELYPTLVPQIKKIELMKEDVHSAVLLATTEPNLVKTLTALLTNYGGEIKELLDLIPKV